MKLSDTVNKNGLVQDVDFFCSTSDTSYPLADKKRNINQYYYLVVSKIIRANQTWQWSDYNGDPNLPIGTKSLIKGQNAYSLIKDINGRNIINIKKVWLKDASGNWKELRQSDLQVYTDVEDGEPTCYDLIEGSLVLDKNPTETRTDALKILIQVAPKPLENVDDEPSFNPMFHRILSLGASIDYLVSRPQTKDNRLAGIMQMYNSMMDDLIEYYRVRNTHKMRKVQMREEVNS